MTEHHEDQKSASDREAAEYLADHLLAPCNPGEGRNDQHVGPVYVREAKQLRKEMKSKPKGEQDDEAIFILESALRRYREVFGEEE